MKRRKDAPPPSLGGEVVDWIEAHLCHGPGDVQGQPIELDDELRAFVWRAYELRDDGQRRFRRAFLSRPKGRAKSELAAMIACVELLGPVRFDGFDAHGEPVGRPLTAPEVLCLATEQDQAGLVYQAARFMLENGEAASAYELDTGLTRTYVAGGGSMEPVTAAASSKDGGRSTFVVADETHLWTTAELRRLHATVRRNIVKRRVGDGWLLETSTAYRPGEESIAEESHTYARLVASGEVDDPTLLVDHREAAPTHDLDSDDGLRAAIFDVYGPAAAWTNIEGIVAEFRDPTTDPAECRRFWLNQVVAASDQWLSPAAWDACTRVDETGAVGERIALGFDGSKYDDSTALVACRLEDGHLWLLGLWERPEGGQGWEVPRAEVDAAVQSAFDRFDVVRLYADPPYWQSEVDAWHGRWGDVVVQWWTNRDTAMSRALERLHTAVLDGALTHDGDPRLARHVANARVKRTRSGVVIRKERPGSPRKIDAAVAASLAFEARADALAAGALKTRSGRSNLWSPAAAVVTVGARRGATARSNLWT